MSRLNLPKMLFWRLLLGFIQSDSGQPPSLPFCMLLHFECLMHQILICHSFILDSSFILWVMCLTWEMCSASALSVEICYLGLAWGFEFDFPFTLHLKFSCVWQRHTHTHQWTDNRAISPVFSTKTLLTHTLLFLNISVAFIFSLSRPGCNTRPVKTLVRLSTGCS